MGLRERTETYFRKRLRDERERRKWSQDELAKRLTARGLAVYTSTIAKIETGARAVRLDEVAAVADLFGLSVDAMLGRKGGLPDEADHAMTQLAETAQQLGAELQGIRDRWRRAFQDFEGQFDFGDDVKEMSDEQCRALLIRTCRDAATWAINRAITDVLSVAEYRAMTAAELPEALQHVAALLTEEREPERIEPLVEPRLQEQER